MLKSHNIRRELDQTHTLKDKGQGIELVKWAFFDRGGASSRNQGPKKKDLPPTIKTTTSEPPAQCLNLGLSETIGLVRILIVITSE